jgi:cob(I)alamin adenosyltransferase
MDKYDALRNDIQNINLKINDDYIKKLETSSINMAMSECLAETFTLMTEKIKTDIMDVKGYLRKEFQDLNNLLNEEYIKKLEKNESSMTEYFAKSFKIMTDRFIEEYIKNSTKNIDPTIKYLMEEMKCMKDKIKIYEEKIHKYEHLLQEYNGISQALKNDCTFENLKLCLIWNDRQQIKDESIIIIPYGSKIRIDEPLKAIYKAIEHYFSSFLIWLKESLVMNNIVDTNLPCGMIQYKGFSGTRGYYMNIPINKFIDIPIKFKDILFTKDPSNNDIMILDLNLFNYLWHRNIGIAIHKITLSQINPKSHQNVGEYRFNLKKIGIPDIKNLYYYIF